MRKINDEKKERKLTPIVIQKKGEAKLNKIGSRETEWVDSITIFGILGGQSGDSNYTNFNAKIKESTHVYICDYDPEVDALDEENVRCIIKGKTYDVLWIDNPDELDVQLEIYLRLVGGQNG